MEGSKAYDAFHSLRESIPKGFGGYYIQNALRAMETTEAITLLHEAHSEMFTAFPGRLPDRVRNNYTVALFGAKMFAKVVGIDPPSAKVFESSISEVVQLNSGRSRSLVDEFTEAVVIAAKQYGGSAFQWRFMPADKTLYVQLSSAHNWWIAQRKRQGRGHMERDAIIHQLLEAPYFVDRKKVGDMFMYGINLPQATEAGLDVPDDLQAYTITLPG
jgi:hypothetical protein